MRNPSGIRHHIATATQTLADAGIDTARTDAELLAVHLTGVERGRLAFADEPGPDFAARYRQLVEARARRVPLQHLTGTAPFGPLLLDVGPGVFIPRPETEALLEWSVKTLERQELHHPTILDLCTGSGALAAALAARWPTATIVAVDDSPQALEYARRNTAATGIRLVHADVTDPALLPEFDGAVDLVVCNPPYIPDGAVLDPEVADHDPHHALFGGVDGMSVIGPVSDQAARWLRPGGVFAVEHDDTTADATRSRITQTRLFRDIVARRDLAGRPRFVTAVRTSDQGSDGPS